MSVVAEILGATAERLVNIFCRITPPENVGAEIRARHAAQQLGLNYTELVCALSFNRALRDLPDVLSVTGFSSHEELAQKRNELFVADIYRELSIDDVLAIYVHIRYDFAVLQVMQYLLATRLRNIEREIDSTVNSLTIERYKKEMRAIYADGIAQLEFAEERLNNTDSGFRALVNEVSIIVDAKLIPVGDIFFRDTVLPEEKRKIIGKGLIPRDLIVARLEDADISAAERRMLEDQLRLGRA